MLKKKHFNKFVKDYHDRIYYTTIKIVGNVDDALDCVQDTFIKAYKKYDKFKGDSSLYTWVNRIAINTALNFVNRNKTNNWNEFLEYDNQTKKEKELPSFNKKWLAELSPTERSVIVLRIYDNLKITQVAQVLNTSESTVKVAYHRAIEKMKKIIKK
ncbi:MAG: sigma-70 family RNA polymerase sigma factor [Candidatus Marinimicrobia bacterium]|nr:sigma-70 family RNA polymerase sigma factor [Candidatus Neomarinimicrobiota bacterium]